VPFATKDAKGSAGKEKDREVESRAVDAGNSPKGDGKTPQWCDGEAERQ